MRNYMLRMPKTVFWGANALDQITGYAKGRYSRAAVFTDKGVSRSGALDLPVERLRAAGLSVCVLDGAATEPSCDDAQDMTDRFRETKADLIVAVGGGSVMDAAKLASIAAAGGYSVRDLLENPSIGRKTIETLMIPTTAGTGAEATSNSIVTVPEKRLKVGIVNPEMIADAVVLDGAMTSGLPRGVAASTGVDALCHAIECYTSNRANAISDMFALESLRLIFANLEKSCSDEGTAEEKGNMLLAAFYAGAAITASGTTAVHALSYPLGGKYRVPHGVANAMLLMPVMRFNREACQKELARVYDMTRLGGPAKGVGEAEKCERTLAKMGSIIKNLEIPASLSGYNVGRGDIDSLVAAGMDVQRLLVNNKRCVTPQDAREIYLEIIR